MSKCDFNKAPLQPLHIFIRTPMEGCFFKYTSEDSNKTTKAIKINSSEKPIQNIHNVSDEIIKNMVISVLLMPSNYFSQLSGKR